MFAQVSPRYKTPLLNTVIFGVISIAWYVGLTIVSQNILYDSIASLGLMIAFYLGITGYAVPIFYRRTAFKSAKNFLMLFLAPMLGGVMPHLRLRQVADRPVQPGELGLGDVLVRHRTAVHHRRGVPRRRRGGDGRLAGHPAGLLPPQDGDGGDA